MRNRTSRPPPTARSPGSTCTTTSRSSRKAGTPSRRLRPGSHGPPTLRRPGPPWRPSGRPTSNPTRRQTVAAHEPPRRDVPMETGEQLYLELLKKVLTNVIYSDPPAPMNYWDRRTEYDEQRRLNGEDWPSVAHTMVGVKRLDNLQACLERVIEEGVPGDFIETGVWRGGVCIFVRAVLKAYQEKDRNVWVADSFQGIPETGSASHPSDRAMALHKSNDVLAVSMKTVQENFEIYGLLDDQVKFLPGW